MKTAGGVEKDALTTSESLHFWRERKEISQENLLSMANLCGEDAYIISEQVYFHVINYSNYLISSN